MVPQRWPPPQAAKRAPSQVHSLNQAVSACNVFLRAATDKLSPVARAGSMPRCHRRLSPWNAARQCPGRGSRAGDGRQTGALLLPIHIHDMRLSLVSAERPGRIGLMRIILARSGQLCAAWLSRDHTSGLAAGLVARSLATETKNRLREQTALPVFPSEPWFIEDFSRCRARAAHTPAKCAPGKLRRGLFRPASAAQYAVPSL